MGLNYVVEEMPTIFKAKTTFGSAITGASAFRGVSNIASGDSVVSVAATAATSGAVFSLNLGQTSVASHRALTLSVNSVVDGTGFVIVANNATVNTQQICWFIVN